MNFEFTPFWEFGAALCLLQEGAYNGNFEMPDLVTGNGAHLSLKDYR